MRTLPADTTRAAGAILLAAGVALCGGLGSTGCERRPEAPAAPTSADLGAPSATYTVRGRVTSLPDPASPTSEFQVRHEAIDDFVNSAGEVVGMSAMVMPFPLASGVSVADLQVGDVVEVEFAVWWKPRRHWEATRVTKLPPETSLEFRPARPPQAAEPGSEEPAGAEAGEG